MLYFGRGAAAAEFVKVFFFFFVVAVVLVNNANNNIIRSTTRLAYMWEVTPISCNSYNQLQSDIYILKIFFFSFNLI